MTGPSDFHGDDSDLEDAGLRQPLPEELPLAKLEIGVVDAVLQVPGIFSDGASRHSGHGGSEDGSARGSAGASLEAVGTWGGSSRRDGVQPAAAGEGRVPALEITEPEGDDDVTGSREAYVAAVIEQYRHALEERTKFHLGYPYNLDFEYGALAPLQHFSINNLGDPFVESNYGVHSRPFEVGVLDWFARLWEIPRDDYWGYITNCGTEGNLHGILVGREVLPDGILYSSRDSHYSVFKAARMYRMEVRRIATHVTGDIDCEDLRAELEKNKDKPAIINVNIGTTVKGAVDDLDGVIAALEAAGFPPSRFYIHCDGALFGLMMPFVKAAPQVTFKKPIGSVSVSGHKFVGCPTPCGVVITRRTHIAALSRDVEYLASRDATIMGSRNGHAALYLWYTLTRKGYRGFRREVARCLRNARYLHERLLAAGVGALLNSLSSTVVFERPPDEAFVHRWQLACQGSIAHAVVMPSVGVAKLEAFAEELVASRREALQAGWVAPCLASELGDNNCRCTLHAGSATDVPPMAVLTTAPSLTTEDSVASGGSFGASSGKPLDRWMGLEGLSSMPTTPVCRENATEPRAGP